MRTSKTLIGFLIGALILCSGCNDSSTQQSSTPASSADNTTSSSVKTLFSSEETGASIESSSTATTNTNDKWKSAYVAHINYTKPSEVDVTEMFTYSLIYLDDDDIPELFISTGSSLGGERVLTYHNGDVIEQILYDAGSCYIPRTGLIDNGHGRMGYYGDVILKLQDHEFKVLVEGTFIEEYDGDGETKSITCEWNGRDCSPEEYKSSVEKLFPLKSGIRPERWYNKSEMLSLLETGHHQSYGHRYKIFNEDVTWDEAWDICKKEGGYLATLTSIEEQEIISELIESEGTTDHLYFVGYKIRGWLNKDGTSTNQMLIDGMSDAYYPGVISREYDPGWRFEKLKKPIVGTLIYSDETRKAYVFNGPADILSVAPQYAGKMGFICEYDS